MFDANTLVIHDSKIVVERSVAFSHSTGIALLSTTRVYNNYYFDDFLTFLLIPTILIPSLVNAMDASDLVVV